MLCSSDGRKALILTVDVEDNFTREELKKPQDWEKYEAQVVINTERVIHFIKAINADATFFVVGKVAERHPELVKAIDTAGYEIGSHSYAHEPVWKMTEDEFEADLLKSISILENITDKKVRAYRAMAFSIRSDTLWALDILKRNGIIFDSSLKDFELNKIEDSNGNKVRNLFGGGVTEFPVSTMKFMGRRFTITGGMALRFLPYFVLNMLFKNIFASEKSNIIYCHVWEFNKDQPRRRVNFFQALSQSPFSYTTATKLRKFAKYYKLLSIRNYLELKC